MRKLAALLFIFAGLIFMGCGNTNPVGPSNGSVMTSADNSASAGSLSNADSSKQCRSTGGGDAFWWASHITENPATSLVSTEDLQSLIALNLHNASGSDFDPPSAFLDLRPWLANADGDPLSTALAVMMLNVRHEFIGDWMLLPMPGGQITTGQWLQQANAALASGADPKHLLLASDKCR